jgi:predicted nucleic acid-binding protein
MGHRGRRYTIDTNLYIDATRDSTWREGLLRFHATFAPFEVLSAVVVQELLAGVTGRAARTLQSEIVDPFERRERVITPSCAAWKETGSVLASLVASGRASWPEISRSLVNDVLLAMSCRESGVVLVTRNERDFRRIADVRPFDFVEPWPSPVS